MDKPLETSMYEENLNILLENIGLALTLENMFSLN